MTVTKRTQGRPPRNSGINGREKLIEATRSYLQSNRKVSLTRTEIAQGCGVTPALISYYFKDKRSLLDAVTKPLLKSYRARLNSIFSSQTDARDRMHRVIRLLLELNTEDAFLVDHALRRIGRADLDAEDRVAVDAIQGAIAELVRELLRSGEWRAADPALAETALWGICRALGENFRHGDFAEAPEAEASDTLQARVAFIYGTFTAHGRGSACGAVAVA